MTLQQDIADHYAQGSLERAILDGLVASGKDPDHLAPGDLALVDEFHVGGRPATVRFAAALGLRPGMRLLDIGSGLGGPSRYLAAEHGCHVTGVDLTEEYVRVATMLAQRTGLADRVTYQRASAAEMPFADGSFDGAVMMHVGMNIPDKAGLFAAVHRVLRKGGVFGIYDVMGEGAIPFPTPWASVTATSFVESAGTYRRLLEAAGFVVEAEHDRRAAAIESFSQRRAGPADGPPPLGLHLVMGPAALQKMANIAASIQRGLISPVEMIARAV